SWQRWIKKMAQLGQLHGCNHVEFDAIVTAEQAGTYKPNHDGFHLALEKLGLDKSEILHAGFGFKYDVIPASELGIKSCWINRYGEVRPANVKETYLVGDMATFALLVKGLVHSYANV
ncbi:HAD family hydrolase, partial [Siminovitchia fortis]